MRMMKNNNNETVMVIGIDHGYGNMKTATRCFPSGVGLGLTIVKDIVESYNGKIEVGKSNAIGGAQFTVIFPVDEVKDE